MLKAFPMEEGRVPEKGTSTQQGAVRPFMALLPAGSQAAWGHHPVEEKEGQPWVVQGTSKGGIHKDAHVSETDAPLLVTAGGVWVPNLCPVFSLGPHQPAVLHGQADHRESREAQDLRCQDQAPVRDAGHLPHHPVRVGSTQHQQKQRPGLLAAQELRN